MGEIKKLNIDFDNNELVLSEEQIEDLLDVRIPTEDNISIHEIIDDASISLAETGQQEDTEPSPQEDTSTSPQEDTEPSPDPVPTPE